MIQLIIRFLCVLGFGFLRRPTSCFHAVVCASALASCVALPSPSMESSVFNKLFKAILLILLILSINNVYAQQLKPVKVGLIVPLSGPWARQGQVMRKGGELAIKHINAQGGIKALGGAPLQLVVFDTGDSVERAKNAAQRMVANEPDLVGATGSYLSSFTLAVTEVTERARLPVLTLSYSDLITSRGFKYVFQTSATGAYQSQNALPKLMDLAETASGKRPATLAIVMDNTAASVAFTKPIRAGALQFLGLKLVVDETFTPPLSNATPLIQRLRAKRPDLLLLLSTAISDTKLLLEKMNEFGLGRGRLPTISNGSAMGDPDLSRNMPAALLEGVMSVVANWSTGGKQEALIKEYIETSGEPWLTQNPLCTYGHIWLLKTALEIAGKADKDEVAKALRNMDITDGAADYFPGGRVRFDEVGRRIDADILIIQWQDGKPVTVYPDSVAVSPLIWPTR